MQLTLQTINFQKFEALENFVNSLAQKRFGKLDFVQSINVYIKKTNDPIVPWVSELELRPVKGAPIFAESQSANYLSAFSQSVNRMQRQVEKYKGKHFQNRA
ncbi:MAG: HPF/RaiA family ribosome-associated protein [Saprospiraceae bacterium]|nr:HPF/RaiA family ribosome-associated protein [Saprospiraceae bacterium]